MAKQMVSDEAYWARRAEQQLALAKAAAGPAIKAIHLNLASRYAAQRELAEREIAKVVVTFSEPHGDTGNEAGAEGRAADKD